MTQGQGSLHSDRPLHMYYTLLCWFVSLIFLGSLGLERSRNCGPVRHTSFFQLGGEFFLGRFGPDSPTVVGSHTVRDVLVLHHFVCQVLAP